MGDAYSYLAAVLRRNRVGMPPAGFTPNWDDKPRLAKYYPEATLFPLPRGEMPPGATLADGLGPASGHAGFDLDLLAGMLGDSYRQQSRRLAIHGNGDLAALPIYRKTLWSRGTASGGGLYPVGIYWVSGASGALGPGVFHYDPLHHGMRRLLTGDATDVVRAAANRADDAADQYLVLTIKLWQSSFKYNNFCFHATTMDIGTLLATWRMLVAPRGITLDPAFWFDEHRLAELLGIEARDEGVFAVVSLPGTGDTAPATAAPASAEPARTGPVRVHATGATPRVQMVESELSRATNRFDLADAAHRATIVGATERPDPALVATAAATPPRVATATPLPAALPLSVEVREALRTRRSSFGRFTAARPLGADVLGTVLDAGIAGAALRCDVSDPDGLRLTKLYAFVNHVTGVAPGCYEFDPGRRALLAVAQGEQGTFLQRNYFLDNYNVEQSGAVLVVTTRTAGLMDAVGQRGYRLANAVVGAAAQAVYTACAALGVGCGAALGFDNISYIDRLGLTDTDEVPLLMIMIGNERPGVANFHYELF